jgi:hypothetical protein
MHQAVLRQPAEMKPMTPQPLLPTLGCTLGPIGHRASSFSVSGPVAHQVPVVNLDVKPVVGMPLELFWFQYSYSQLTRLGKA